jgi:hypothetical protein
LDFFPDGIEQDGVDFNFTGVITYTYDETGQVPEPGTMAMMGILCGVGLPFLRRMRRKISA